MRVLHVLAETGYSGGELQLQHVVQHLQQQGHTNSFVLAPGADFAKVAVEEIGISPAAIYTVDLRRPGRPRVWSDYRSAVFSEKPDILHFGCGRSLLWAGVLSSGPFRRGLVPRGEGFPLRITTRRIDYPIAALPWKGGRYKHFVDHVIANCLSVARRVRAVGVSSDRVTVVHEGIDIDPWRDVLTTRAEARGALDVPQDAFVVACPATLRPRKGQRVLIDAFAAVVRESTTPAVLLLAGGGPDADRLRGHARDRGLGNMVRVLGPVRPVTPVFAAADVLAMPSFNEGLANACLEGSAAGLPLVVSDVGGLPEIVAHGETGFVVPPGDDVALASALVELAQAPERRGRFGRAGAARTAELFTAERSARTNEELWLRLLAAHRAAGCRRR